MPSFFAARWFAGTPPTEVPGSTWFPARWFAPRWFAQGWNGPIIIVLPSDFLNAVKERILNSGLAAALNGAGVYLKKPARNNLPVPFIVVEETGASLAFATNTLQIHDTRVRFRLYGEGAAVAGGLGDQLEDLMSDCSFAFTGGFCSRWLRSDRRHEPDQELSTPGNEVWYLQIEYTTKVKR